jgi:speckle-type POZ protein
LYNEISNVVIEFLNSLIHVRTSNDLYGLESLKSMCEEKLCSNHIDTSSAAGILALAEQHCCPGLKEACLEFLGSPAALLAVIETKGFEYLARSCPGVAKELMVSVICLTIWKRQGFREESLVVRKMVQRLKRE